MVSLGGDPKNVRRRGDSETEERNLVSVVGPWGLLVPLGMSGPRVAQASDFSLPGVRQPGYFNPSFHR